MFELHWTDENNEGHSEYFPNTESAEQFLEVLRERFVIENYSIELVEE